MRFDNGRYNGMEFSNLGMGGMEFGSVGYVTAFDTADEVPPHEEKSKPIIGSYKELIGANWVQGYATRYFKCHLYKGRLEAFEPGCFGPSLTGKSAIRLQIEHDVKSLVCTTNDTLQLYADDDGLAFRALLPDTEVGFKVQQGLLDGSLTGMSVGYTLTDSKTIKLDSGEVELIKECDLREISICKNGCVPDAYATLIDIEDHGTLEAECKSGALLKSREKYRPPFDRYKDAMAALGVTVHGVPKHLQLAALRVP
jgi:HK97 family phage prohead protease